MVRRALAGLVLWGAAPTSALAQMELTWDGPAECPRRDQVLGAVRDIVGDELYRATNLVAEGQIRTVEGGYRLELQITDNGHSQVRTLQARVCKDLVGATAVVLGLNVRRAASDPPGAASGPDSNPTAEPGATGTTGSEGAVGEGSPKQTPNADQPTSSSSQDRATQSNPGKVPKPGKEEAPDDAQPEADSSELLGLWFAVPSGAIRIGAFAQPAWMAGGGLGIDLGDWRIGVNANYQWPQDVVGSLPDVGAQVRRYSGEVTTERLWRGDVASAAFGVFIGADYISASGKGQDLDPTDASLVIGLAGPAVSLRWHFAEWGALCLAARGELPLSRPRLVVSSLGDVAQLGPIQGRFTLATEWGF